MGVVMTLLAGSFAIWGINDIFRGFGRSTLATDRRDRNPDRTVPADLQRSLAADRPQLGHPLPPDQASALGLDRQVLGEMIAQAGARSARPPDGARLSDAEIAQHITSDPHLQNVTRSIRPRAVRNAAARHGLHRAALHRRAAPGRCCAGSSSTAISGGITPPQAWLDAINQFQNEQRSIRYVTLGPAQAGDIPQPTDDQLSKYFDDAQDPVPGAGIPQDRRR